MRSQSYFATTMIMMVAVLVPHLPCGSNATRPPGLPKYLFYHEVGQANRCIYTYIKEF